MNGDYSIEIKNNAVVTMNVAAPTSGDTAGISLMGLTDEDQAFDNNTVLNLNGALYFPNAKMHFYNNSTIGATACTQIIANTIHFENNVSLDGSACVASRQMVLPHSQLVE